MHSQAHAFLQPKSANIHQPCNTELSVKIKLYKKNLQNVVFYKCVFNTVYVVICLWRWNARVTSWATIASVYNRPGGEPRLCQGQVVTHWSGYSRKVMQLFLISTFYVIKVEIFYLQNICRTIALWSKTLGIGTMKLKISTNDIFLFCLNLASPYFYFVS